MGKINKYQNILSDNDRHGLDGNNRLNDTLFMKFNRADFCSICWKRNICLICHNLLIFVCDKGPKNKFLYEIYYHICFQFTLRMKCLLHQNASTKRYAHSTNCFDSKSVIFRSNKCASAMDRTIRSVLKKMRDKKSLFL